VEQVRRLDRWVRGRISHMLRRVGFRHASRSELLKAGYRPLIREYWSVRRQMGAPTFPFRGMIGVPAAAPLGVQEGPLSYGSSERPRAKEAT
jgi:hypothetical protein